MSIDAIKDLPKKHRTATILLGLSVVLGVATVYRHGTVPDREQELEQQATEGRRLQTNITNGTLLRENLDNILEQNKQIAAQLVNPNQLGENLQFFYRIETASGTKVVDLRQTYNPQTAKSGKSSFVAVPYVVTVRGDYKAALNFIRKIEKSNRIARISTVSLAPATSDRSESDTVLASINLELLGTP